MHVIANNAERGHVFEGEQDSFVRWFGGRRKEKYCNYTIISNVL